MVKLTFSDYGLIHFTGTGQLKIWDGKDNYTMDNRFSESLAPVMYGFMPGPDNQRVELANYKLYDFVVGEPVGGARGEPTLRSITLGPEKEFTRDFTPPRFPISTITDAET